MRHDEPREERISTLALFGLMTIPLWIIGGIASIIEDPGFVLGQLGLGVSVLLGGLLWTLNPPKDGANDMRAGRLERKRERRMRRLLAKAEAIERQLDFSSDFFIGSVAGPRVRGRLADDLVRVEKEIQMLEASNGES